MADESIAVVCETCQYRDENQEISDKFGTPLIECRRYAPKPRKDDGVQRAKWPRVRYDDWCGEWKAEGNA